MGKPIGSGSSIEGSLFDTATTFITGGKKLQRQDAESIEILTSAKRANGLIDKAVADSAKLQDQLSHDSVLTSGIDEGINAIHDTLVKIERRVYEEAKPKRPSEN